jgi:hypothetical protein
LQSKAGGHGFLRTITLVMISVTLGAPLCAQQIVRANEVEPTLDASFRSMYNLQFDEALRSVETAKSMDASDPLPWVAEVCAIVFREFDRLRVLRSDLFVSNDAFSSRPAYSWIPANKEQFEEAAAGGEKIAKDRLAHNKNDVKALFALSLITGLRGDAAAMITKQNLTALSYLKTATAYSDKLLAVSPDYYDAYVGTGLGKYIIGQKAAPVRWILRIGGIKGDQEQGLKELGLAADRGRFLKPFALIVLAFDDLKHKNTTAARKKLELLHQQFPGNLLFAEELAKTRKPADVSAR